MWEFILNLFGYNKNNKIAEHTSDKVYSDFDYVNLCELYFNNGWLEEEVNHKGLENLWFDYKTEEEKNILKNLINNFTYLKQEEAEVITKNKLDECLINWNLSPNNTLFIGFKNHKFPDGSSILLNFFKAILSGSHLKWEEFNFLPDFDYGMGRIKDDGFIRFGLTLENIVLVDDFIGTGGTAVKRINEIKNKIIELDKEIKLYMFSLAMMEEAIKLIKPTEVEFESCQLLKKGTELAYPYWKRVFIRKKIQNMERILFEGSGDMMLENYTLGYGKSESLYNWNRFNMPNNNYPIFWWHKYLDGTKRKTMFNRLQ